LTDLSFLIHGATLALAWLLLINVAATALVALLASGFTKRTVSASPALWLTLRLSPGALSLAFVAFVFLPSYWRYEPREFVEGFDLSLTTLAALALALLGAAIARGIAALRIARHRSDKWVRAGKPLTLVNTSMPPSRSRPTRP